MTSDRPYVRARSTAEAVAELHRHLETQFDSRVVDCFVALLESGQLDDIVQDARKPSEPARAAAPESRPAAAPGAGVPQSGAGVLAFAESAAEPQPA
jgi:ribosomal protein L12E/L44/L45/RPP1/RPP2